MRWQCGLGRKASEVEIEVATAVNLTPSALHKWRLELGKVFGERRLRSILGKCEELGRYERRSKNDDESSPDRDEEFLLYMASETLERDLSCERGVVFPAGKVCTRLLFKDGKVLVPTLL